MAGPLAQALITGATGGIGEAFAALLPARTGLLLTGRDAMRLAALAERHVRQDRRVETLRADLAEAPDRERLVARAAAMEIDLLVNNAGLGKSEEHTSELQSLMRNSYAVFCLKKKKEIHMQHRVTQHENNKEL